MNGDGSEARVPAESFAIQFDAGGCGGNSAFGHSTIGHVAIGHNTLHTV